MVFGSVCFCGLFLPVPTHAGQRELQTLIDNVGLHCQLWLKRIRNQSPPMNASDLSLLLNRPVSVEEAEALRYQYSGLPDFGFVLGKYWEVASRAQRNNFNYYFSKLLEHDFPLSLADKGTFCSLSVSIATRQPSGGEYKQDLPQQQRHKSITSTELPTEKEPIKTQYFMLEETNGWHISEIQLNDEGLKARYGDLFQQMVRQKGFQGLINHLIQRNVESLAQERDTAREPR